MSKHANDRLTSWLRHAAADLGFMLVGVTPASLDASVGDGLDRFLQDHFEGDMGWLRETAKRRRQPRYMWEAAQSAIVLAMNYGPDHDPMDNLAAVRSGNISVYARGRDYHDVIKGKLKQLAGQFASKTGNAVKVFVDTAPLMEKPLAQKAGLGWQGKHTNLVSRTAGSWLFLGVILTDAVLVYDQPETNHCGSCQKCLDICPTGAFPAPYRLDARRCISYLTIEHKGQIPKEFRQQIGNRIFGCDDCLAICPWNKFASLAAEQKLVGQQQMPSLYSLLNIDDTQFRKMFSRTPIKRIGHHRFLRNVLLAAGNSGDQNLGESVINKLKHSNPLVRGMAVWALAKLVSWCEFDRMKRSYISKEVDHAVLEEWYRSESSSG